MELSREEVNKRFAERTTALKQQKGVTLKDISDETGINTSALHGYMEGYRRVPLKAALIIADYFNVSIEELVK